MKRLIVYLLILCGSAAHAQEIDTTVHYTLTATIPVTAKNIETDRLGNVYVVNSTNQLYKYSNNGKLLSTLNYNYQGNIFALDASNSMEIYVYYKELNRVIFLDNNLAYRGEVDLITLQLNQASTIARSYDNGMWAFDLSDLQLKKLDKDGRNPLQSGNIRQFTSCEKINPFEIYDNGSRVYLNDSLCGILVFDVFTGYVKTIPLTGCNHIKQIDDYLYCYKEGSMLRYNLKTVTSNWFRLPVSDDVKDISIEKDRIYILKSNEVQIYSY